MLLADVAIWVMGAVEFGTMRYISGVVLGLVDFSLRSLLSLDKGEEGCSDSGGSEFH